MPPGTTNTVREIGITIFMSAVGIYSGPHFVSTVVSAQGLEWLGLAAFITFIPMFTVGMVLRGVFKVNYLTGAARSRAAAPIRRRSPSPLAFTRRRLRRSATPPSIR
jgi:uncharacterized transporter YbjL